MFYTRHRGFTLIEILVTVGIIGIIAAIAIPSVMKARAKSKLSNCEQNMRSIAHGCDAFINDYSESALANVGDASLLDKLVEKHYLAEVPTCPCEGTYNITTYDSTDDTVTSRKKFGNYCITCTGGKHTLAGCDGEGFPKLTEQGAFIHTEADETKL